MYYSNNNGINIQTVIWRYAGPELNSCTIDQSSMVEGFSSSDLKTASQRAPTAPSTTLWSQLIVTDITFALRYLVVIVYACMAGVP